MKTTLSFLLALLCLVSCNSGSSDLMKLIAERDSLKAKVELQETKLQTNEFAINTINSALDSISIQEGLIFSTDEREVPITKSEALKNLERFQKILDHQKEKIASLQSQLKRQENDGNLQELINHLKIQIQEKDAQIASLRQELTKKDVDINRLRKTLQSQQLQLNEQSETIALLDKKNKAQIKALSNQDRMINTGYVLIGTKSDLKRKGIIKGNKLLPEGILDKSKFAKVDIRNYREIEFEAKRPQILTNMPTSAYTITTTSKHQYTLHITDVATFWSISNFLIIQTN